jgi:GDSL-like Lipase/Acylhydrolase family
MKNKICFYGSSITAQLHGMVTAFQENNSENFDIIRISYGGTTIEDAGICFINNVLNEKPNYCFIDWFGPTYPVASSEDILVKCMDTFITKLIENNCIPIFLLCYRTDDDFDESISRKRVVLYKFIENYCKKYKIHYISLYSHPDVILLNSQGKLLADSAHVTKDGAKKYSDIIEDYFYSYVLDAPIATSFLPQKNELYDIKEKIFNESINTSFTIHGQGKLIGILHLNGPHSGILDISDINGNITKIKTWDKYCYSHRKVVSLVNLDIKNSLKISISKEEFDRTVVFHKNGQWREDIFKATRWDQYQRHMKCLSIFYTGIINKIEID